MSWARFFFYGETCYVMEQGFGVDMCKIMSVRITRTNRFSREGHASERVWVRTGHASGCVVVRKTRLHVKREGLRSDEGQIFLEVLVTGFRVLSCALMFAARVFRRIFTNIWGGGFFVLWLCCSP